MIEAFKLGADDFIAPTIYTPLAQAPDPQSFLTVALRATTDPALLAAAARREVRALRADVPVGSPRTMEEQIAGGLRRERVLALLSTWFSLLAVLLACIGLYGVMSYDVSRRTREIGIRMAIGATRLNILRQVLRRVAAVAVVGVALGLVATLAATRVLSGFLYGVSARDPLILGGAAALLVLTALVAGSLPARAASLVDPARALRSE